MQSTTRVTVAGAGALGLSCALALADAGCEVVVSDPAAPFANASGVAGGMLAPVFEAVLDAEAAVHAEVLLAARDRWPTLAARAGVALDRRGTLAAGRAAWLEGVAARVAALGAWLEPVSEGELADLAPGLAPQLALWLNREDWRLDARGALTALRAACADAGVEFRAERVAATGAGLLVLATGAAGGDLAPELDHLQPIKGHILRAATVGVGGLTVRGEAAYVAPADGGLAVGATMEPGVADPTVDPAQAAPLRAAGASLFPALAQTPYELFAGVRAATPDGLPLVGWSREPGVLLATGARRNGWLLAPMVAETIAACVTGRDPGPYAARLDPRRFEGDA